jgi:hypothetical protein
VTAGGRPAGTRRWAAGLAWGLWGLAMAGLAVIWWLDLLLRQAGRADRAPLGAGVVAPVLAAVSAATWGPCWPAGDPGTRSAGCCWPWACC